MKYISFLLILFGNYGYCQTNSNTQLATVIGPSPDVSTMQKYGDYKVSTYTGIPEINIPLYTIKLNDISIPISISYNASGIKVDEEASRVGLGWTLNAGGTISRIIKGMDDLQHDALYPVSFDLIGFPKLTVINNMLLDFGGYTYNLNDKVGATNIPEFPNVEVDLEPDIFYCNFLNYNKKFVINRKDTSAMFEDPSTNMKVKFNIVNTGQCTITTTAINGTVYYFNQFEFCQPAGGQLVPQGRITAWYLTKILTTNGTEVNFNYTKSSSSNIYTLNQDATIKYSNNPNPVRSMVPYNLYTNLTLDSITTSNCNVYFNYDSRLDVQGDKRLTFLTVTNSNKKIIKKISLIQDYFTANASIANTFDVQTTNAWDYKIDSNWIKKRLKLTEIKEMSGDSQIVLSHKFMYNENLLPLKNSTSRDHWDYFNNASNGNNLIPDLYWAFPGLFDVSTSPIYNCDCAQGPGCNNDFSNQSFLYQETPHKYYMHNYGANREVDTNYSQAFILNQIIYPTGGFTKFTFEQNTCDKNKSFVNDPSAKYYNYNEINKSLLFVSGIPGIPSGYSQTFNFNITASDTLSGEGVALANLQFKAQKGGNNTSTYTTNTDILITNSSGMTVGHISFNSYNALTNNGDGTYSSPSINSRLPIGTYTIKITYGGNIVDKNSVYYTLIGNWPISIVDDTNGIMYKYGGGLRVKNISNYSSNDVLASSVNYIYHFTKDNNHDGIPEIYSMGKLMGRPNYFGISVPDGGTYQYYLKSESSVKSNIGYDSVITIQDNIKHTDVYNNNAYRANIYKWYYTSQGDEMMPIGIHGFPSFQVNDIGAPANMLSINFTFDFKPDGVDDFYDNANGKLIEGMDYLFDPKNSSYTLLKRVQNTYSYNSGAGTEGIIWADKISSGNPLVECLKGLPTLYGTRNFFYPAFRSVPVLLTKSIEKNYKNNDSLVNTIDYFYNNSCLLQKKNEYNSKKENIITYFKYPLDYNINGTPNSSIAQGILNLQNSHILSVPIEQYTQKSNEDGSNLRTSSAIFNTFKPTLPLRDIIYDWESATPSSSFVPTIITASTITKDANYQPTVFFDNYDNNGNILQEHKSDDIPHSYIWDYNSTYPISEVINASQSDIAYSSFEADGKGNWTFNGTPDNSGGAITGEKSYSLGSGSISKSGLTSATKYIISYWSKGSVTVSGGTQSNSTTGKAVNGWAYHEVMVTGTTSISISGSTYIDELRLYPSDAQMTTYTYEPLIGMTSQCDAGNKIQYYEYDAFGRLQDIKDMDGNIIKTFEYHYKSAQ